MDFLKKFAGGNKTQQPVGAGGQPAGQKDDYVDKSKCPLFHTGFQLLLFASTLVVP